MPKSLEKSFAYFRRMTPLKKVLTVFIVLVIFIIIVEQPGSDTSKRQKSSKFFIPRLVIEDVEKIKITNPINKMEVSLVKQEGGWRVANGHFFPADLEMVEHFLETLHGLKEEALVSKNPERMTIFAVDEQNGIHVEIWSQKERNIADLYAGKSVSGGQYFRKSNTNKVIQVSQNLNSFLFQEPDSWKDKILLTVNENDVRRIALKDNEEELVLEKRQVWRVVQPEDYEADTLAMRTLFDQLKKVRADGFADVIDSSQVDFENSDYKISIRLNDDSLKLVLFGGPDEEGNYFAKNGERNVVYSVSQSLIDGIFSLEFKVEDEEVAQ